MLKRFFSLFMAAAMLGALALTGCSSSDAGGDATKAGPGAAAPGKAGSDIPATGSQPAGSGPSAQTPQKAPLDPSK